MNVLAWIGFALCAVVWLYLLYVLLVEPLIWRYRKPPEHWGKERVGL